MHTPNATHNASLTGFGPDASLNDGEDGANVPTRFPPPAFPAWVPSVTVALAMLIFLAASFYVRHRKVVKKRELLMDYFYIIFQYGGLRRKRMVAALCNTNAITLRELGRSFMISFDSVNNPENSCPFFMEDGSAFDGTQNPHAAAQKKTFFNRAVVNSRKYRMNFRRWATQQQSEENQPPYPVAFHDILMKFKSKRPPPAPPSTPCLRPRSPSTYELQGSSMCTIHGDDFDYQKYMEENDINSPVFYRRMRRNAYVPQPSVVQSSRFADLVTEVGRHSLGNVFHESIIGESGKRNSEPFEQGKVFQVQGNHLTPPGTSPSTRIVTEPTILVHSASSDWANDGNGWTELPGPSGQGGVVFVRRLSKADASPDEYSYSHENTPRLGRPDRANLSKVSYVQSGNMNEYYNCLQRGVEKGSSQTSEKGSPASSSAQSTPTRDPGPGPPRNKRGRLSLGEIAVTNFNRRIDLTSDSLREYDPEVSPEQRRSNDLAKADSRSKNKWARFKHVFTGSRLNSSKSSSIPSNNSGSKDRTLLPYQIEERVKRGGQHQNRSRWQKFVNVFTGFRSLPEQKSPEGHLGIPPASRSYPAGLDMQRSNSSSYDRPDSIELNVHDDESDNLSSSRNPHVSLPYYTKTDLTHDMELNERSQYYGDVTALSRESKPVTQERSPVHPAARRFRSVFLAYKATRPSTYTGSKRYRKRYDSVTSSSQSLPHITNFDFKNSPTRRVRDISPLAREYHDSEETTVSQEAGQYEYQYGPDHCVDSISSTPLEQRPATYYSNLGNEDSAVDAIAKSGGAYPHLQQQVPSSHRPADATSIFQTFHKTPQQSSHILPHFSGAPSNDVYIDMEQSDTSGSLIPPLNSDSLNSSSCDSQAVNSLPLLQNADTLQSPQRPHAVSLSQQSLTQGLLSPDNGDAGTSSESIYYDSLTSPLDSPVPIRTIPKQRSLKARCTVPPLNIDSSEQRAHRFERTRLSVGNSAIRLETVPNKLASPDLKGLRRRSEELRPRKRAHEKSTRSRSAANTMSSVCSSLLTSTEVILVPMTISAPDSPSSDENPTMPSENSRSVNHMDSEQTLYSQPRLLPSQSPDHYISQKRIESEKIRFTVSNTNRSEWALTNNESDEAKDSPSSTRELRRKSDTLFARLSNPLPLPNSPRWAQSNPASRTSSTGGLPSLAITQQCMVRQDPNPSQRNNVVPGVDNSSGEIWDKQAQIPTATSKPHKLHRQASQDLKKEAQLMYSPKWEPTSVALGNFPENEATVTPIASTSARMSPPPPTVQQPLPLPSPPAPPDVSAVTRAPPCQESGNIAPGTGAADTTDSAPRTCSYDTLI